MASPLYVAKKGTYEEFCEVFDPAKNDVTDMLFGALTNGDPEARAKICNDMLDRGADASREEYGQNALTILLGRHRDLGDGDAALVQRLIDGGADVNFRNRSGDLPIRLAITVRVADDEQRREVYEALFGTGELDLSLPSSVRNPVNTIGGWLRMNVDGRPGKLDVLDEFLQARGE
ncbi:MULTISPECIES: hypothetical protein [Corynebacterium]|uniref:Ankyrin repeat domain-containing protein n=2 Tax=Corynebacterium TaxID=1716 RepID=A0AB36RKX8_9CORY|nr:MULTISPECIES: hypothetical protein [Corynebacterium]PAT04509.1 hypothetical protein CKJ85_03675 [Corynebacterium sp. NML 150383]PAT10085.1 hypothetical protein CKJ80_08105 [Corynebacterium hadale]PAT15574.1 hypothetical protein CKJ84_04795 [Corynebacterium sp. NML 120412]RMD20792.1 hypothetical protein EAW56_01490 [Corynebacterium gottingense]WJZ12463.1 hypothetical protein CGOTT_02505 [Corynebacterium gottingense]